MRLVRIQQMEPIFVTKISVDTCCEKLYHAILTQKGSVMQNTVFVEKPTREQVLHTLMHTPPDQLQSFIDMHKDGWMGSEGALARACAATLEALDLHCKNS